MKKSNVLLALAVLVGLMILPQMAAAQFDPPWWNDNWLHRAEITLGPATPSDSFQVKVELTTSNFTYAHAQDDGDDIRFLYYDAAAWFDLDYWIEDWDNTGTSKIWVEVQPLGQDAIYMYYSNASAATASNKDAVFPLYDNFEGQNVGDPPDGWTIGNPTGGAVEISATAKHGTRGMLVDDTSSSAPTIFTYKNFIPQTDPQMVEFYYRFADVSQAKGYQLLFDSDDDCIVALRSDGSNYQYYSGSGYVTVTTMSADTWYHIQMYVVNIDTIGTNDTIRLYIDDVLEADNIARSDHDADDVAKIYITGHNTMHTPTVYFDDVIVRKYSEPEPVATVGEEVTLPVELSAFTATYVNEFVTISWQTASETDVIGFNIYRSEEDDFSTTGSSINSDIIPGNGTTSETNEYHFTDETADPYYTAYYYWLEVVNLGGGTDLYGSIKYEPGDIDNNGEINIVYTHFDNCYPNPATSGNTIQFGFRLGGLELTNRHVELKVYNVLGELVEEIVNEDRLVDDYTEQWTPKNLPSGIYFYQLKTENYNETKKMLLLR